MNTPPSDSISDNEHVLAGVPEVPHELNYADFRQRLGTTHRHTMELAKALNVKLSSVDKARAQLDIVMRVANQPATRMQPLPADSIPLDAQPHTRVVTDTIGSTFPQSLAGNSTIVTWQIIGSKDIYVTVGRDHSANSSWQGFRTFARDAGLLVHDNCVSQGITIFSDGGSEYKGDFATACAHAGITQSISTPHKSSSGQQGRAESNNGVVQRQMRVNFQLAAPHFASFKLNVLEYWDFTALHSARQLRLAHKMSAGVANRQQSHRALPTHFGGIGTVHHPRGGPERSKQHKQLAERAEPCLFLGTADGKYLMLSKTGKVFHTMDVIFYPSAHADVLQSDTSTTPPATHTNGTLPSISTSTTVSPTTGVRDPSHALVPLDDGIEDASTDPTFLDADGAAVHVGDSVNVEWVDVGDVAGVVTAIDVEGNMFEATYDDGTWEHELDDFGPHTHLALATRVPTTAAVHPSVAQYVSTRGDILPDVLHGRTQLPDVAIPKYTRANAPKEPGTVAQALAHEDAIHWLKQMVIEFQGHVNPDDRGPTFEYTTDASAGDRPIFTKWVFVYKFIGDVLDKLKARMVAAAWGQTQFVDYIESYTGTAPVSDLRDLECIALLLDLDAFESDLKMAYCHVALPPRPDGKPTVLTPAKGTREFTDEGALKRYNLNQAIYGLPTSGYALARELTNRLLNRKLKPGQTRCPFPMKQCVTQPVIFIAEFPRDHKFAREYFIVWVHVDNVRSYPSLPCLQELFMDWFSSQYTVTGGRVSLRSQPPQACLGMEIAYSPGVVTLSMPAFIRKLLSEYGMQDCNPALTPLVPGTSLSAADAPTTDADRDLLRIESTKCTSVSLRHMPK
ncbi:MAG: hypothetical protein COB29_15695 [Sulfitobacter sp.]|nr:MAG: hypothetical protein COB29_15695 [Sulfitobacter sp.]